MTAVRKKRAPVPDPGHVALTSRQRKFVHEYAIDMNGKRAALRAGYAHLAPTVYSQLLRNPKIKAALVQERQRLADSSKLTQERVLAEYAKIGFSDIRDVASWDADGNTTITPSEDIDGEAAGAIAEISGGRGGLKLKLHDKRAALDAISRMLGFNAPAEVSGPGGAPIQIELSPLDAARRIAFALAKAAKETVG